MTATQRSTPEPAFMELDFAAIGDMLVRLPAISAMLRHTNLGSTLDYISAEVGPHEREMEFVRDVLTMKTADVCEKWYGGREHAARLAGALVDYAMAE